MQVRRLPVGLGIGISLLIIVSVLQACSPAMERQLQTAVAGPGATVAVELQTQAVKAGQTVVAGGVIYVETQAVVLQKTAEAGIKTQAVVLQKTAEARMQTEAARISTEVGRGVTPSLLPISKTSLDYFALGDSIASGHGLLADTSDCHRSDRAYPYPLKTLLEQRYLKVNLFHYACSGATAVRPSDTELKKDKFKWFRNQVDETLLHLSNGPTLITITIGANDLDWTNWQSYLKNMCLPSTVFWDWIAGVRKTVSGELYDQIQRLVKGRPNVSILLTEVYNPVNTKNSIFLRLPLCGDILGVLNDYQRTHYMITELNNGYFNDVMDKLGSPKWMWLVPIDGIFSTHAAPYPKCGDGEPDTQHTWIQYPGDTDSDGEVPYFMEKLLTGERYGDCFHPNAKGAKAIADQINTYVPRVGK